MVKTYAVLAGRYRGKAASVNAKLTHACRDRAGVTLCGKIDSGNLTESPDENAPATCPVCAKRDPRRQRHANDGPFVLKSLLQF